MEVVTGRTDYQYSQVSFVPGFQLNQSYSFARTNRSRKPEKENVHGYEGLATMGGSRVDAILSSALTKAGES